MTALLTILAMTMIIAVRYLVVSGGFAFITRLARPGIYAGERMARQIRAEIGWSLIAAVIYAVPAGMAVYLWQAHGLTRIYTDAGTFPLAWLPGSVAVYLLLHDTYFYWTHRWMHGPRLFRLMHKIHHDSRPPTAWAAMSFHPWESLSGAVLIPALTFLIPVHIGALGVVLTMMTLFGVTNHIGWEIFPARFVNGTFGRIVITASHHQRHHQNYLSNFGLYFRHWDYLCGTDQGLGAFAHDRTPVVRDDIAAAARRRGAAAVAAGNAARDA